MPLTFSHPAAVLPLMRPLRKWSVPSALVIGSMVPDFAYFIPLGVTRTGSHSLAGIFWFCLPLGLVTYLTYHLFLKYPLVSLLPDPISRRMSRTLGTTRLPNVSWLAVNASLLIGTLTHLAWDSFTHAGALGVETIPFLRMEAFVIDTYHGYVYKLIQYFSSGLGLLILGIWGILWFRKTPPNPEPILPMSNSERIKFAVAILTIPFVSGLFTAIVHFPNPITMRGAELLLGRGAVSVFSALGIGLLFYASWWHIWKLRFKVVSPPD